MLALALACVFLVAAVGSVHADSLAICRFQGSDTITGWITLTQYVEGGVVTIGSNFTSSVAVSALYAHVHTYGDLDGERECFVDYTYGPWSSAEADTHFTNSLTVHGFSLSGDNSIVGRSISLYESISNCAAGCNSVAVASCVVGKRNYAVSETTDPNTAAQVLSEDPASAYVKFVAGSSAPALAGEAWFVPTASGLVYVKLSVSGLTAGSVHAVHVHTYGDIHLATGVSAGLHLNPAGVNHGYPPSVHRHMGDLGNFTASDAGVVEVAQLFDLLSFTAASGNIIGRGLIIHTLGDDGNPLNTNTSTGAAGGRLGMGVVAISARLPEGFVDPTSVGDDMYTTYTASDFVSRVAVPAVAAATESRSAALHRVAKVAKALLSASAHAANPVDVSAQRLLAAKALLADRAQEAADAVAASATAQCSAVCQLRRATQAAKMLLANAKPAKSSNNVQVKPKQRSSANVEGVTVPPQGSTTRTPSTTSGTTSVSAPPKTASGKLSVEGVKPVKSSNNMQVKPKQRNQAQGVTVPPQGSSSRPSSSSGTTSTPVSAPPKTASGKLAVEVEAKPAKSSNNVQVESPVRKLRRAKVAKASAAGAAAL